MNSKISTVSQSSSIKEEGAIRAMKLKIS